MRAATAVVELLKSEPEWRRFFKRCCETGSLRLRSQAWQCRDELADRGQAFALTEVEDALMRLARKFFPESPGALWDADNADGLCKAAMDRLQAHLRTLDSATCERLDLSDQDAYEERMVAAGQSNDPAAFRRALKGWELVGVAAIGESRAGRGAA